MFCGVLFPLILLDMAEICSICNAEKLPEEKILVKISLTSFDRIKEFSEKWSKIGKHDSLHTKMSTAAFSKEYKYHRNCYIGLTHKNNLRVAQEAFEAEKAKNSSDDNNNNNSDNFDLCVICQSPQKCRL